MKTMLILSVSGFIGLAHTAIHAQSNVVAVSKLIEQLHSVRFEWRPAPGVSERGAIIVPIQSGGRTNRFQLDTGADTTMLYGTNEAVKWGWRQGRRSVKVTDMRVADARLPAAWVQVREGPEPGPGDTAGTLGFDLLAGQFVIIDYPGQRFCLYPRAEVPGRVWDRVKWTPGAIRNGKFFFSLKINGKELPDVFLDTGSSLLPVLVDYARWKELTGCNSENQATTNFTGSSWGKAETFLGKPAAGDWEMGALGMGRPVIYFSKENPESFKSYPFTANGLVGNAPFWNEILVLDLGSWPAIGILR